MKRRPLPSRELPRLTPDDFDIPRQESYALADLARYLDVSEDTIKRTVAVGELEGYRANRSMRFKRETIERWFAKQQERATAKRAAHPVQRSKRRAS